MSYIVASRLRNFNLIGSNSGVNPEGNDHRVDCLSAASNSSYLGLGETGVYPCTSAIDVQ